MSNIYDSANELSRGLRELPEYKAVKAAKDAIQADEQASKIFVRLSCFPARNPSHGANWTNARCLFPRKNANFQQSYSRECPLVGLLY